MFSPNLIQGYLCKSFANSPNHKLHPSSAKISAIFSICITSLPNFHACTNTLSRTWNADTQQILESKYRSIVSLTQESNKLRLDTALHLKCLCHLVRHEMALHLKCPCHLILNLQLTSTKQISTLRGIFKHFLILSDSPVVKEETKHTSAWKDTTLQQKWRHTKVRKMKKLKPYYPGKHKEENDARFISWQPQK